MPMFIIGVLVVAFAVGLLAFGFVARRARYQLLEEAETARTAGKSSISLKEDAGTARLWSTILFGSAVLGLFLGALFIHLSMFYQNSVGEAKVLINSVDRKILGSITEPSAGYKPFWVDLVTWNTFNQELLYAGAPGNPPEYSGGTVKGAEITVSVGGISGGATKADMDASFVYTIDPEMVEGLQKEYKSQELFTQMIVERQILSIVRPLPSQYTAASFRGEDRPKAEKLMTERINEALERYGVTVLPTIQDIRYSDGVEAALTAIEEANQEAQRAEATQRTRQVEAETKLIEAQGQAAADIEKARGQAEANRILAESLTDPILKAQLIEAYNSGTVYVTDGSTDLMLGVK